MDCIWGLGSSVLGRYDGEGRALAVGCRFWMMDRERQVQQQQQQQHQNTAFGHHEKRDMEACFLCVCLIFVVGGVVAWFLARRFVSCALLGWMDGWATLHNATCMC